MRRRRRILRKKMRHRRRILDLRRRGEGGSRLVVRSGARLRLGASEDRRRLTVGFQVRRARRSSSVPQVKVRPRFRQPPALAGWRLRRREAECERGGSSSASSLRGADLRGREGGRVTGRHHRDRGRRKGGVRAAFLGLQARVGSSLADLRSRKVPRPRPLHRRCSSGRSDARNKR